MVYLLLVCAAACLFISMVTQTPKILPKDLSSWESRARFIFSSRVVKPTKSFVGMSTANLNGLNLIKIIAEMLGYVFMWK